MEQSELYLLLGELHNKIEDEKIADELKSLGVRVLELEQSNKELILESNNLRAKLGSVSANEIGSILREENDRWYRVFGIPVFPRGK